MTEPVRIVPYDPAWPDRFEQERALLHDTIGKYVTGGIHHIGSTAVPGLDAKPIIDILAGTESLEATLPCIDLLGDLEYKYAPYRANEEHWFCKPDPARRTHHLHLVPTGSPRYEAVLRFRDLMRASPELCERYAALKHELAIHFRNDRDAYTEAKQGFIRKCLSADKAAL